MFTLKWMSVAKNYKSKQVQRVMTDWLCFYVEVVLNWSYKKNDTKLTTQYFQEWGDLPSKNLCKASVSSTTSILAGAT